MKISFAEQEYKIICSAYKNNFRKVDSWEELYNNFLPKHEIIDNNPIIKDYLVSQFINKKGLQTGFLTESLLCKDLAIGLGMKQNLAISPENEQYRPRYEYSDGKGNFVLQLGQPDQTDCLLINNGTLTWLEIKEPNAKFGETALVQDDEGKLSIRTTKNDWSFYQPLIDNFNENENAWDWEDKSYLFNPNVDTAVKFLQKYFDHKHIDKIMTWNQNGDIEFYSIEDIRKALEDGSVSISGEIRTGKDRIRWNQMTAQKTLIHHLKEQGAIFDSNIVAVPFDKGKYQQPKYHFSSAFFIYTEPTKKTPKHYQSPIIQNGKMIFDITNCIQIPDLISFRIMFLK